MDVKEPEDDAPSGVVPSLEGRSTVPRPGWGSSARVWACAVLAAASLAFGLDSALGVGTGHRLRLLGPLSWATLAGLALFTTAACGALAAAVGWTGRRSRRVASGLAAALAVGPAIWMGNSLASGAWVSRQGYAWAVRWGPGVVAASVVATATLVLLAYPPGSSRRPVAALVTAACFVTALGLALADALIMPGLHATFHILAHVAFGLTLVIGCHRLLSPWLSPVGRRGRWLPPAVAALAGVFVVGWVTMPPRTVGRLLIGSSQAGYLIREFGAGADAGIGHVFHGSRARPLLAEPLPRGLVTTGDDWNVVLIIVDTLRADALGPVRGRGGPYPEPVRTPFLDSWGENAFRFERAYAQASVTNYSIPPLMRSVESHVDFRKAGVSLPAWMGDSGRHSFALVNQFFVEPHFDTLTNITADFERVSVYDELDMNAMQGKLDDELDAVGGEPFFAWIHFYNMHAPGWNGERLGPADGKWPRRYVMSAAWLDEQVKQLVENLERRGLADRTIIVLASDHGEGLGEHGANHHGETLFEEVLHVPLWIHVPGLEGRVVSDVVSNIDIVPTVTDLLGAPAEPGHRGMTLVPLMMEVVEGLDRSVYATNWTGRSAALVHGNDKIIYDGKAETFLRFDLAEDPDEEDTLFGDGSEVERDLQFRLLRANPRIFEEELQKPERRAEIERRLAEVDPLAPTTELEHFVRMAAVAPTQRMSDRAVEIFDQASHDRVRALVLAEFFPTDRPRWAKLFRERIGRVAGTDAELEFVDELASTAQEGLAFRLVGRRMSHWAEHGSAADWRPWLRLVRPWQDRRCAYFSSALTTMLRTLQADPMADAHVTTAVLRSMAALPRRVDADVADLVARFVDHPTDLVRVQALKALGRFAGETKIPVLVRLLEDPNPRIRLAALETAISIRPGIAEELLLSRQDDPMLVWTVVRKLERRGSEKSLSFLRNTAKKHPDGWTRKRSKEAIEAIESRIEAGEERLRRPVQATVKEAAG